LTDTDVRRAWLDAWRDTSDLRIRAKQSQVALFDMFDRYRALSAPDKQVVDELLAELVMSPDERVRFDVLAVIDEFRITSALPALRALANRLEGESSPGAPYEWEKVNRMIGTIASDSTGGTSGMLP
jgi:hypothetical protein